MANRTSSRFSSRAVTIQGLLGLVTLTVLSILGIWDSRRETNNSHVLILFIALFFSGGVILVVQLLGRRTALLKVQHAEDSLRSAMAIAHSAIWDLDVNSGQELWFGDLKTLFGIPSDTLCGQGGDFYRYLHPNDRGRVLDTVTEAREKHTSYTVEFRTVHKDGSIHWISATGEFRYSERGDAVRLLGTALDITDRKQAEEARDQSEEKFYKAFHRSPVAKTLTSALDHRYLDVNDAFERYSGWKRDEVIGRTPLDLNIWVDAKEREHLVNRILSTGSARDIEVHYRRKDGGRGIGLSSTELIQVAGEPCMLSAIMDITDRKRAEEALQRKEHDLAEAQRLAHIGSWQYGVKDQSLSWSEELRRIHGLDANQPTPSYDDLPQLFTPESRQLLRETMAQAIQSAQVPEVDLEILRPDGTRRWVATRGRAIRDASGDVVAVRGTTQDITERKHSEETLRLRERDLAEAQRLAHVGSWEWSLDTGAIHWSAELYSIYGLDSSKPAPTTEELPKLYTLETWNRLQEVMNARSFPDLEMELVRPDGTRRWVLTRFEAVYDSQGRVTKLRGISQDITEEKRAQDQLRESERRFRRVVEHIGDAVIADDADGHVTFANERFLELFGIRREQLPNLRFENYIAPEFRDELVNGQGRRLRGEAGPAHFECEGLRTDRTRMSLECEVVPITDSQGKIVGTQSAIRDISERKHAEQVIRDSEERFRLVANTAPVMIWMVGTDNQCTYLNKRWLEFTGRELEAELGRGWVAGIHPDDLQAFLEARKAGFIQRANVEVQYRLRRHDAQYRWILDFGVPRFDSDGSFTGYIGSCIDITERKEAEEAMASIGRRLIEAHEEERTRIGRELHDDINQRLALLAVELDRLKQILPSSPSVREHLRHVQQRIHEIANDIQSLSHRLHSSKLDYLGLPTAASSFCRELSEKGNVNVHFSHAGVPRKLPKEVSLCLFRVLQEALQNAVKHSGVRDFTVTLHGTSEAVELTVTDSGVGFDEHEALTRQGIGLISMRERLQLLHGTLSIKSRPGAGTAIHARVPLDLESAQALAG